MNLIASGQTYKYILKMALPAIAGLSTQMVVSLVDTAMVGRIPEAELALAAQGLGVLATFAIIAFFSSLATGTHVLVARRFGEQDYSSCGKVLNTSLIISFTIGIIISVMVIKFSYPIGQIFAADPEVGKLAGEYLYYRFMGITFFLFSVSFRGFYFGIGRPKIFLISAITANVLNTFFNYIFIFGAFGITEPMGLAGAGLGSSLATVGDAGIYFVASALPRYNNKFHFIRNFAFIKDVAKKIINISLPVSFQNVFILVGFLSFVAITGLIGTPQQSATQVVISSLFISIMPCFGFGIAVHTLVGNNLGALKIKTAKFFGFETMKVASIYTLFVGIVFIGFPDLILKLLTNDQNIIEIARPALRIAGFGQIFYSVGVVLANGLQAAGQTFFVMVAEIIANWVIGIPLAYILGVWLGFGLAGAWIAIPVYVIIYSLIIWVRFSRGDWENFKKV